MKALHLDAGDQSVGRQLTALASSLYAIARTVLGLIFIMFGLNDFVPFIPYPPSIPEHAGAFFGAMVQSHFAYFVFGVQLIAGILLVINRFVPLALVMLAGVIANILAFHIAMWPATIVPFPALVTVLWFIVAWRYRTKLNPLLQPT